MNSVYSRFVSDKEYKIQGYAEIINQQQGEFVIAESNRVWLTNIYTTRYFNNYVKNFIKSEIVKRIIVNGLRGSSWYFKRFQRLTIIAASVNDYKRIIKGL